MLKIGFLSHSDMSIYFFRLPLMRALNKLGHKVYAIMPKGRYFDKISQEFECIAYDIQGASINPLLVAKNALSLAKALAPLHLDMLQSAAHKSNIFGTMAGKMLGIKHIFCIVEGLGSAYTNDTLKNKILRFVLENLYKTQLNNVHSCIFVNSADAKYFQDNKICQENKICVIKSVGINCDEFDLEKIQAAQQLQHLKDKKIILMISRALKDKGIKEFYEASKILANHKNIAFVFAGEGVSGKNNFSKEFLSSCDSVLYIGWSDEVKSLLKSCYVYVLPSYKEGFPRTILEAMSMSKPCVASNVTGCNEAVIDGVTGLLCNVKDAKDLADKILNLVENENLAFLMGENARKTALQYYDEKIIIQKYLEAYRKFCDV